MTRRMNIAFVNQPYDRVVPPGQNSIGLIVYNTALELAGRARLMVYAKEAYNGGAKNALPFDPQILTTPLDDLVHQAVVDHPRWAKKLKADWLLDAHPQYARRVRSNLDESPVDIVHVMNYWHWSREIGGGGTQRKLVLEMQCEWLSQGHRKAIASQLKSVDAVVGVSDHITNLFRDSFPDFQGKVATSYNGVDTEVFRPADAGIRSAGGGPRVLFVGRVSPEKGVHCLLEAFAVLVQIYPDARLDFVGTRSALPAAFIRSLSLDPSVQGLLRFYDGSVATDYQQHLDDLVNGLGIADNVKFHGPLPHDQLVSRYQAANLLVNPSLSESFGISIVEGMASGVPVIGATVGGMKETIVDGETGLLIEPERPEALAEAMKRILGDEELASSMGENGRKRAVDTFSWKARADRLFELYSGLCGAGSAS
jgi:glycosyltransferase involved in cell wall biosynthesis